MQRVTSPIFIVGSSRSGTTLLSYSLRKHPNIHITAETHYFDDLHPRLTRRLKHEPGYDYIPEAIHYFRKLDGSLYGLHGDPEASEIIPEAFREAAEYCGGGPDAFFEAYCLITMHRHGKSRWGEKTPRHIFQIDTILKRFPQARIVFMVRDPRAVVASYSHWKAEGRTAFDKEADLAHEHARQRASYHPLIISWLWRSGVQTYNRMLDRHGSGRIHSVRYEDLAQDPEPTLKSLCGFLDEAYDPAMLDVAATNSSFTGFDRKGGITTASIDRWRKKLTPCDVSTVQWCCRSGMEQFGYELDSNRGQMFGVLRNGLTFPFAVVRAATANRERIGHLPTYVWRRLRGTPC